MQTVQIHPGARPTAVRWKILAILALASFVSYVLRTNLSFAAPEMMQDLGLSEMEWGWVLAAFTAGYALFQIPGGMLGDRFGPRRVLTAIAVAWAVLTLATSLAPGQQSFSHTLVIAGLFGIRFMVGAAHAPIFPVMNASIVRWFPRGAWALPLGLASTALTLGGAAAAVILPLVIATLGWRLAFLCLAPLALLTAAIWWWYSRDNPADHRAVNEAELELIKGGGGATGESARETDEGSRAQATWKDVLKNRDVLFLMLSYSSMNYVFYIVFNWFFYYLVEIRGFSATSAGFVASAQWMAGAAGAALGGWLCDRLCRHTGLIWGCRWPIMIGMSVSAVLLLLGALHPTPAVAVTAMVLLFFFNQLNEGPYWATSVAVGGQHAGAAGGVMNTGANIMGVINALLVPMLAHAFGWTAAIASGALFAIAGLGFMLLVRADRPIE